MALDEFVDMIRGTFDAWKAARASLDGSAIEKASDQLVWLARLSVEAAANEPSNVRNALVETLGPVADKIEEVAEVLRKAGWR